MISSEMMVEGDNAAVVQEEDLCGRVEGGYRRTFSDSRKRGNTHMGA